MSKPRFVATLLLQSNILSILGNLSRVFQVATLNLLNVGDILQESLSALESVKKDPLHSEYMMNLEKTLQDIDITRSLIAEDFVRARTYIDALISNIKDRFPHTKTLSSFGYLDPRNVNKASVHAITEFGELMSIDGLKLWEEFIVYRSFAQRYPDISAVVKQVWGIANKEAMTSAFPLISDLLARLIVLPASSAHVERMFSTMKRSKTAQRNRLKTTTLDNLLRISAEGPPIREWNANFAMRKW